MNRHPKFAAALRATMRREAVKVPQLAVATGLSHQIIYGYTEGRYIPTMPNASRLAEALNDDNLIALAKASRYRRCELASCRRPFWRDRGPQKYCTSVCTTLAAKGLERRPLNLAQDAIDDMCRACEPEGVCRTDSCPLREFSPLPYAAQANVAYVGDPARAAKRATWRDRWAKRQAVA